VSTLSIYQRLTEKASRQGAAFAVLFDPDKQTDTPLRTLIANCEEADVDLFLIGGSSLEDVDFEQYTRKFRSYSSIPIVGFPGSGNQLSRSLDAVLYLSLVSGRNPDYLIGRHLDVAPRIRDLGLEAIPTAYVLVESGEVSAVQRVTQTVPIPRDDAELAVRTALASELMGMQLVYLEAGSGAPLPVPVEMVAEVSAVCDVPIMVGGGLKTPEQVAARVTAGASFIVIGNAIEKRNDVGYLSELADAAHVR